MKQAPRIGVIPLWDEKKNSIWMIPGYMESIIYSGGLPYIMPLTSDKELLQQSLTDFDGVLFTGGQDVSPRLYNTSPINECGAVCKVRDDMEKVILDYCLEKNLPLFGICRGIQIINVCFGGTLYQDIPTERLESENVCHNQAHPYDVPVHQVNVENKSPLRQLLGTASFGVNSCHHQAIKKLASDLSAMAFSEDGIIEAVYYPGNSFLWAVQWHPELTPAAPQSKLLFDKFIAHAELYHSNKPNHSL